jgi:alanine racemase
MTARFKLDIDNTQLINNYNLIKNRVSNPDNIIGCCIKSNAYGLGMIKVADILNKNDNHCWFCVQSKDEGVELRKSGFKNRIIIISSIFSWEIQDILEYNLTPVISTLNILNIFIDQAKDNELNTPFKIHLMFESGMNWLGLQENDILKAVEKCKQYQSIIELEGIATHFATSDDEGDEGKKFFEMQMNSFLEIKSKTLEILPSISYFHCANSGAIMNYDQSHLNIIQPGILLYGLYEGSQRLGFEFVGKLKTHLTCIRKINKGEKVGYSNNFIATKDSVIATLPIGYANGFMRLNSGKLQVQINGEIFNQIGNIGMNSMMIDISNAKNKINEEDKVLIIESAKDIRKLANNCLTIDYEIITSFK